jgi:ATP-binding cassette subfamily B protein
MNKMENKRPKAKKGTLLRLLKMIFGFYPISWVVIFVCLAILVVANASASIFLQQTTIIIEEGLISGFEAIKSSLFNLLFVMIAIRMSAVIATFIQKLIMAKVTQGSLKKVRTMMFNKMQKLPISYFDQNNNGDIIQKFQREGQELKNKNNG